MAYEIMQNQSYHKLYMRKWSKKNPNKIKDAQLRNKFGFGLTEYNELLERQNGVCALCGGPPKFGMGKKLAVDHDHVTGQVRGLLCGPCNTALGRLGDTILSIEKVLAYLKGESS